MNKRKEENSKIDIWHIAYKSIISYLKMRAFNVFKSYSINFNLIYFT